MRFALASGARPLDGYTVKRGVGVGGFGEVYFAVSDAGKEVALKRINRNLDIELRGVKQCLNLKHINLVDLYDIRQDELGEHWVVMEFVGGESLSDALDRYPSGMPEEEIRHWYGGLLSGVGYLHRHGIVHRDLKPGNIFADQGVVKIGDYGLSKFISCSRRSGHTESVGTLHYMAPEIGQGRYGKEIDIYALGILLHELVTGRVPFDGESSQEIIIKHLTAKPELHGVAEPYRTVIAKSLEKDPARRYADVAEIAEALSLHAESDPAAASHSAYTIPADQPPRNGSSRRSGLSETVALITAEEVAEPPQQPTAHATPPRRGHLNGRHAHLKRKVNDSRDTAMAALLAVATIVAMFFGGPFGFALVAVLAIVYATSAGVRTLGTNSSAGTGAQLMPPQELLPDGRPRYFTKSQLWRREKMYLLRQKSTYRRTLELTDGMLVAAIVVAVLSLVMVVIAGLPLAQSTEAWSVYLWLCITTTLMSWALLAAGKIWEGQEGEPLLRRFGMLVLGLAIGAFAWGCQSLLMIDLPPADVAHAISSEQSLHRWYSAEGAPMLGAFLIYFAGLMVVPRWWLRVDPLRKQRIEIWPIVVYGFWGFVLNAYWPFTWGWMIAVTATTAIQIAAAWLKKERSS